MSRDHEDRMESFYFAWREAGLDEAVDAVFRSGVDWARRHIGPVRAASGSLYRVEVAEVAAELGTTPEALWDHTRSQPGDETRALAMWLLRRRHGFSYPAIGRALRRDHTCAIKAMRKVDSTPELMARAEALLAKRAA